MKPLVHVAIAAILCLLGPSLASAHHLWLEVDGQDAKVYFGEFAENLREVSPGSLDRLQPQAKAVGAAGDRPLTIAKTSNGFAVSGQREPMDSIVAVDDRYPVFVRTRDGLTTRSRYLPAARFVPDRSARAPSLELDVVPVGGDKFQVVLRGKALAKAKVEVITPSGWGRELHTGDDGEFVVALPWRGPYVLEVQHADRTPGKIGEEPYDLTNYVTSLTVVQADGLAPVPALPPAKPH